jgi:uridine kinase
MTEKQSSITVSEPRTKICVTLPNDLVLEGPVGALTGEFLHAGAEQLHYEAPLMGAVCDGQLRELNYALERDARLEPVLLSHSDGGRIYRRSLVLLMAAAAGELWPGCRVSVRHAVPDGGFYCTRLDGAPFTTQELAQLERRMRTIIEEDAPISKRVVPLDEAEELFASRQEHDKVRLLSQRTRQDLTLYRLHDRDDYYYGYMLPSTGYLRLFRLIWVRDGFILQYPRKESTTRLRSIRAYDKLSKVFHQADQWLIRMNVEDVGQLNSKIRKENQIHELILVAEALHEQRIAHIADEICQRHTEEGVRIILIAGPSSSGKTTFSKRLAIQLLAYGLRPFTLELDNYFVDRTRTPKDEKGDYDFEALEAVDLPLFNAQLLKMIQNEEVQMPSYNFITGESTEGRVVKLEKNQIIIIEGIHGLNPALVPEVPDELIFRIYVSALTQLNIDAHNRVPTTDVRLLRRMVRDARARGYSANDTLTRWPSVRRGERKNIFPFQENADVMFNSALVYELAALRPLAEPLLLQVPYATPAHIEAKRLLSFLGWVHPLHAEQLEKVPDTSLLREFIGKSSLSNYHSTLSPDEEH